MEVYHIMKLTEQRVRVLLACRRYWVLFESLVHVFRWLIEDLKAAIANHVLVSFPDCVQSDSLGTDSPLHRTTLR